MKILVTGAAGEFGRDLVPWLARRHDVRATDIVQADVPCEFIQADLTDPEQVGPLTQGVDGIIHLAVLLPHQYPTADFVDVNVKASTLLCEAAVRACAPRMVYVSTVWATGHGTEEGYLPVDEKAAPTPQEMYGLTKLQGELSAEFFARVYGLSTIVVRMCGYVRSSQFAPDGTVDLSTADLPALACEMLRPGQKLYNPNDLGRVMEDALMLQGFEFERVIVGNHVPWKAEDAEELVSIPLAVAERYYPGSAELFGRTETKLAPIPSFYSVARARQLLGFRNEHSLNDVIAAFHSRS